MDFYQLLNSQDQIPNLVTDDDFLDGQKLHVYLETSTIENLSYIAAGKVNTGILVLAIMYEYNRLSGNMPTYRAIIRILSSLRSIKSFTLSGIYYQLSILEKHGWLIRDRQVVVFTERAKEILHEWHIWNMTRRYAELRQSGGTE